MVNHWVVISTIYNQAMAAKLVDPKHYPFGKGNGNIVIKFLDTLKIGLTIEEIAKIEMVKLDKYANHARNLFLFSLYFGGVRISDVLIMSFEG